MVTPCEMELRKTLERIAKTRITHLRSNQMQATLHDMRNLARAALERCYGPQKLNQSGN